MVERLFDKEYKERTRSRATVAHGVFSNLYHTLEGFMYTINVIFFKTHYVTPGTRAKHVSSILVYVKCF